MSESNILKRPRASTRAGRERAFIREEMEQNQELFRSYLIAAREAGRVVSMPADEGKVTDKLLRAEARLLDRRVKWNDSSLHEFIGEAPLGVGESRAARTEKIVKRVKARLGAAEKTGRSRESLLALDGNSSLPWPSADGPTTFGFAKFWARRVAFESPEQIEQQRRASLPLAPPGFFD